MSKSGRPNAGTDITHGYVTVHDWDGDAALSDTLIGLLEEVQEVSLADDELLYETVDPDALDELFNGRADQSLVFEYQDCKILVKGDGTILVHPPIETP